MWFGTMSRTSPMSRDRNASVNRSNSRRDPSAGSSRVGSTTWYPDVPFRAASSGDAYTSLTPSSCRYGTTSRARRKPNAPSNCSR